MKPLLTALLIICLTTACSKKEKDRETELTRLTWLDPIIKDLEPCFCKTNIYYGVYEGKTVYEVRGADPICDGINMIYSNEGKELFHSGNKEKYQDYRDNVKEQQLIWSCDKATTD
jgi:hypothetical protein